MQNQLTWINYNTRQQVADYVTIDMNSHSNHIMKAAVVSRRTTQNNAVAARSLLYWLYTNTHYIPTTVRDFLLHLNTRISTNNPRAKSTIDNGQHDGVALECRPNLLFSSDLDYSRQNIPPPQDTNKNMPSETKTPLLTKLKTGTPTSTCKSFPNGVELFLAAQAARRSRQGFVECHWSSTEKLIPLLCYSGL